MRKTVTEVSRELGVAKTTLMYWWLTDRIPAPAKIGGARVWTPAQIAKVAEFVKEKRGEK